MGAAWNEQVHRSERDLSAYVTAGVRNAASNRAQGAGMAKHEILPIRPPGHELSPGSRARARSHSPRWQESTIASGTAGSTVRRMCQSGRSNSFANVAAPCPVRMSFTHRLTMAGVVGVAACPRTRAWHVASPEGVRRTRFLPFGCFPHSSSQCFVFFQ